LPTIYGGDRLWLPDVLAQFSQTVPADVDDEIAIRIDGKVFRGWTASNIQRSIKTIADGFSFKFPTDKTNRELIDKVRPYTFRKCDLFIGGELYIAGQAIKWNPTYSTNETTKTVDVRTKAGATIECMAQRSSLEFRNQTLAQIATAIMQPYGDDLKPLFFNGDSDRFTKVRKEITDTDFDFLSGLASQKGFLITSSDTGQLAFIRANVDGKPVARIIEGISAIEHMSATYDGQKRFSSYQAVTESAGTSGPSASINDPSISAYRPFVFSADDLEAGNLDSALKWRRSKALADSSPVSITMTGWRNELGMLWRENQLITVLAPSIDIYTETAYIITGAKLDKNENGGNIGVLELSLPQAYTLDFPSSFPYEGYPA
jgi:prophage tail gpP-like protein